MLKKCDLSKKTDDRTFARKIAPLQERLGELQRQLRDEKIPVIIVIEGWNASGITMTIQELIRYLDPRGFTLSSIGAPTVQEKNHPLMWRFWNRIPAAGRFAIFARSWYSRALAEETDGPGWEKRMDRSICSINRFERVLSDDATIIIKIFLHISKKEQKKRLLERETNPLTSWMITKGDWDFHRDYDSYLPVIDDFLKKTDTPYAPWTVVGATDPNHTILTCYATIVKTLEKTLPKILQKKKQETETRARFNPEIAQVSRRSEAPDLRERKEYEERVTAAQKKVRDCQYLLYKRNIPLAIVFEGRDAAGKGGTIMRLTHDLNPRGYSVMPVGVPNDNEKEHHYLWRFIRNYPAAGNITIYDRSWYGRVLVERVEGLCTKPEWRRAYTEINEMEEEFRTWGGGLLKFWLEVSFDEQLRRFRERETDPLKQWKITDEDWRNREKWDLYGVAIDEMFAKTSTKYAPWTMIESDDKWFARTKTLETVAEYCEHLLQ
ncbi:MAG: polyphosphate:AMP phosphotransferase [Methanoregula sp.]|jgi:polyphosphate:AMP phosphotransferase|uniref:polyphosphate:AMP phosphotransferase n=1 Tax=Methanoregula sp. TaxID=2052170 RepID=UPI003C1859C0